MGTLTYTELVTEIKANLGNRSAFDANRLLNITNMVQQRIARKPKWKELKASTEGTFAITATVKDDKFITVPANTRDILTFRVITSDGKSKKLVRRTTRQMDKIVPEPEYYTRGDPLIYSEFDGKLELWRVPENADPYIIRRTTWPTAFDGTGSQTSDLEEKDDMIVALSSSWALQSIGRLEDAARWWRTYQDMYDMAKSENDEEPDEEIVSDDQVLESPGEYWLDPFVPRVGA